MTYKRDWPKVGDRVKLTQSVNLRTGRFAKGTEMVLENYGARGWDMIDDDGNYLRETMMLGDFFERIAK